MKAKNTPSTGSSFLDDWKRRERTESKASLSAQNARDALTPEAARVVAEMSTQALRANYQAIAKQVDGLDLLPMVKANAYGHGAVWAARTLLNLSQLYALGVATLQEALELRNGLGQSGRRTRIIVFSECADWNENKGQFCEQYAITPVIASEEDWTSFVRGGWNERLSYELKFNTGMNRLGIPVSLAGRLARFFEKLPVNAHPDGIFSHLAMAETPESHLSRQQREKFLALRTELASAVPAARFHLGNSAAIWKEKNWSLKECTDVVRPGLSLYGVLPWAGAPARGIVPVMTLKSRVISSHRLKPGETVGYGGRYKVGPKSQVIAVVAAGYADGIHRTLSGTDSAPGGYVWLRGREQRILGAVSMDMCTVSSSPEVQVGDWVEFLGPSVDAWAQAARAGTIPYELLTSVSGRVQRVYD